MRALFLALLFIGLSGVPSWADVDQHCLAGCVSTGGAGNASCLAQCSYNIQTTPKLTVVAPVTLESLEVHRTFPVPVPTEPDAILPKAAKVAIPEKDPICVRDCLHAGLQYDYCDQRCVKSACAGSILCPKAQNSFVPATVNK